MMELRIGDIIVFVDKETEEIKEVFVKTPMISSEEKIKRDEIKAKKSEGFGWGNMPE